MEKIKPNIEYKPKKSTVISLEKGKLPPQAVDLEEAVLGALMIHQKSIDEIIDLLTAEVFYKIQHQYIYEAIHILFKDAQPIDLFTVASQLKKNG